MLDSKAIINGIRASHLTRYRLFEYLTSSLDRLATVNPGALADRVLRNSEGNLKAPNGGNYCAVKMRSREYTVVLAIAMMDGSFNVDRQAKWLLITGVAGREVVCIGILQGHFSNM